jgi:3-hydroxy-3-methylglutaryl CoA synthase
VGLCGLIKSQPDLAAGDRIGIFSYGSGAIGEFYSGVILPEARAEIEERNIDEAFDARKQVSVQDYEYIENLRVGNIEKSNFVPDFTVADNWYKKHYKGRNYLVLKEVKDYCRIYAWS